MNANYTVINVLLVVVKMAAYYQFSCSCRSNFLHNITPFVIFILLRYPAVKPIYDA